MLRLILCRAFARALNLQKPEVWFVLFLDLLPDTNRVAGTYRIIFPLFNIYRRNFYFLCFHNKCQSSIRTASAQAKRPN